MKIRPTKSEDSDALRKVVNKTGLFPADMLPDMLHPFLASQTDEAIWLTCELNGTAIGFCFARPEEMTEGTWNMLAIAVLPEYQGTGAGRLIVKRLEEDLKTRGQRVLIVDTSGADEFSGTRKFYGKIGYTEEARIRDFWAAGDDKVVFWKAL
ncbi:MAG: GNAT family N-acetyltransferase [Pseudomonadota bacterium]